MSETSASPDAAINQMERTSDRQFSRELDTTPIGDYSRMALGAVVPILLAMLAVAATGVGASEKVCVTAWVAVCVVGTTSVICGTVSSQSRHLFIGRLADRSKKDIELR